MIIVHIKRIHTTINHMIVGKTNIVQDLTIILNITMIDILITTISFQTRKGHKITNQTKNHIDNHITMILLVRNRTKVIRVIHKNTRMINKGLDQETSSTINHQETTSMNLPIKNPTRRKNHSTIKNLRIKMTISSP